MPASSSQPTLPELFRSTVLRWARAGEIFPCLAGPGCTPPHGITLRPIADGTPGEALPDPGVHANPYPCLIFVVEGEADIRIGTSGATGSRATKSRAAQAKQQQDISILSLPLRSCLILPPGVPYSDGTTPHWERENPASARSRLLWIQVLPTGAVLHLCRTESEAHTHSSAVLVRDTQLYTLCGFLLETDLAESGPLANSYLTTMLLRIDRNIARGLVLEDKSARPFSASAELPITAASAPEESQAAALERACRYVDSHLTHALTPDEIARAAFVSLPALKRLFAARLGTSVMKHVSTRRIAQARTLLQDTSLTVQSVGEICGYPHRTHFSRVFKAHTGASPDVFRRQSVRDTNRKPSASPKR